MQSAETISCGQPESVYITQAVLWLMIAWRRKETRHQQPWYWPSYPGIVQLQHQKWVDSHSVFPSFISEEIYLSPWAISYFRLPRDHRRDDIFRGITIGTRSAEGSQSGRDLPRDHDRDEMTTRPETRLLTLAIVFTVFVGLTNAGEVTVFPPLNSFRLSHAYMHR